MLTLDDIRNLPNDPTPEHLIAAGLLPAPAPAAPAIPPVGPGTIPKPSPVNAPPTLPAWHANLAAAVPKPREPLPPLSPVTAPDLGAGILEGQPTAATNAPIIPQLPHLGFKERQALPLTSEGVAPGSKEEALAKLERLEDQKANPWGSPENHPGLLGKIGHIAAKVGNIAGDIVAPATMANIPGTDLNKQIEEGGLRKQIAQGEERELAQKKESSEEELRAAQTRKLGAGETPDILQDAAGNAVGWRDEKGALHSLDEEGTPASIKSIADKWQGKAEAKPQKENMEQGLAGAVQDAIENGRDPKDDPAVQRWAQSIKDYKPTKDTDTKTAEDLKHRIVVAMESGDVGEAKRLQAELNATDPEGMARLADAQARMAATNADRAERTAERQEKQGLKWVTGESADGKTVTVPYSQAQSMGLKNQAEANTDHVNKVLAARVVVPMLFNNDPNDMGVVQIVNELDKQGKLGPLASRWNDFLARKWGGGDPLYAALLTRLDLAQTKMMQAHVGNRGGAWMLEHFEDLANARKLDAPTLRATLDQELRYMSRSSERPSPESVPKHGEEKSGHSFSINGQKYVNVPDDVYQRAKTKPGFKE